VLDNLVKPNGIVGTAAGKLLYVTDAGDGKTYVYRIQPDGSLADRKLIAPVGSDGMTLDEKGNLYLARNVVHVYSPEGKNIATIEVPEAPSKVCFGAVGPAHAVHHRAQGPLRDQDERSAAVEM